MRLVFNLLLVFFIFSSTGALSENLKKNYILKAKGFVIGEVLWKIKFDKIFFETTLSLKSTGLLSKIYSFEGEYTSSGFLKDKVFEPTKYSQKWITKKKRRDIEIVFKNFSPSKLVIIPEETEKPRIDYKEIKNYKDPLSSFLNILINKRKSPTFDGRRVYLLVPKENEDQISIAIKEYKNVWADHKRNDLEYIKVLKFKKNILPNKIKIGFRGSEFTLIEY